MFSDSLAYVKIKHAKKLMVVVVQGRTRMSENYLTQKIIARNILDTKYL